MVSKGPMASRWGLEPRSVAVQLGLCYCSQKGLIDSDGRSCPYLLEKEI